jgi:polar amino acid transport system substrate-binding protein
MSTRHRPSPSDGRPAARRGAVFALATASLAVLAACSSVTYAPTALPSKTAPATTPQAPATSAPACDNATQSYDPLPSLPSRADITDGRMKKILAQGYLRVGVSADTYLFGARDPETGQIAGFDIDIAKAVAKSLFGDDSPTRLSLRVITAGERLPLLESDDVDMVARNMSMTCARWNDIAFSAEYYRSGQKVLISKALVKDDKNAATWGLPQLRGKRVCAPTGTTSLTTLQSIEGPVAVTASNHTGCLVLLQQGKADAITGDDTVLAGLAAQDPNTVITSAKAVTTEPYGLGFNKDAVYLVRYTNRVLADLVADGRWKATYNRWLAGPLGPAPAAPTPVYGRR